MKKKYQDLTILRNSMLLGFVLMLFISCKGKKQSIDGIYLKKENNIVCQLKIININDSLKYFELEDTDLSDQNRRILGVLKVNNNQIQFINSDAISQPLNMNIVNDDILFIDSSEMKPYYHFFGGKYIKQTESDISIHPELTDFYRESYYYEYKVDTLEAKMILYHFPAISNKADTLVMKKGEKARMYTNVFEYGLSKEGPFYYMKFKQGEEWKSGWMYIEDYRNLEFLWKIRGGLKHIKNQ